MPLPISSSKVLLAARNGVGIWDKALPTRRQVVYLVISWWVFVVVLQDSYSRQSRLENSPG